MRKLFSIITILVTMILLFCACVKTEIDEYNEPDSSDSIEETTLNNLPDNKIDNKWLKFESSEFNPDLNSNNEKEIFEDGSYKKEFKCITDNGKIIEFFDKNNNITDIQKETYYENGFKKCIYCFDENGVIQYACAREYDELDRFYRYYYYDSNMDLKCYEIIHYDGFGNQTGNDLFDIDGNKLDTFPENLF